VGTFAVQIDKILGAEVTGVCSARNVDMGRSLGADHVVDYTQEDFTKGGPRFDLILDNVGSHSFSDYRRALTPNGVILPNTGHASMSYVIKAFALSPFIRSQGSMFSANADHRLLSDLRGLIESGQVRPVIDRMCPLSEAREALRYLGDRHVRGRVVLIISGARIQRLLAGRRHAAVARRAGCLRTPAPSCTVDPQSPRRS